MERQRNGVGGVERVNWRFEPCQGFNAGHNSMCGDCVEGLASTASPRWWTVVCGGRGFRFQRFSPPSCGLLDVFVHRGEVNLKIHKEGGKTPPWCIMFMHTAPSHFCFNFLFFFSRLVFSWQLAVSCRDPKSGHAEEFTSTLILAMGS